jgi:predicted Zn-dependent peptidase
MNSRLSLALRERSGLAYHSESNYTAYSDSGVFMIYFGTDPGHYDQALEIVFKELKRLRLELLSGSQLATVKRQISGQLAIGQESNLALMLAMGKSFLLQNRFDPIEELIAKIQSVTATGLADIANEILGEEQLSVLTYQA